MFIGNRTFGCSFLALVSMFFNIYFEYMSVQMGLKKGHLNFSLIHQLHHLHHHHHGVPLDPVHLLLMETGGCYFCIFKTQSQKEMFPIECVKRRSWCVWRCTRKIAWWQRPPSGPLPTNKDIPGTIHNVCQDTPSIWFCPTTSQSALDNGHPHGHSVIFYHIALSIQTCHMLMAEPSICNMFALLKKNGYVDGSASTYDMFLFWNIFISR